MKLTKKDLIHISKTFDIGTPKDIELIEDGMINTNFVLTTDKGEFVLRFLRKNADDKYVKERKLEFKVLDTLQKNNYPYQIPFPIKDSLGNIISELKGRKYWIYRFMEGDKVRRLNLKQVKQIARAISKYHFIVSKIKGNRKKGLSNLDWMKRRYNKMKKAKGNNILNKTMLKYFDYFEKSFNSVNNLKFEGKTLPVHADFHQNNVLFKEDRLVGVLDFDNVSWSLKSKDLANCMKSVCKADKSQELDPKKIKAFLQEYRKHNSLTDKEIRMIKPLMIRNFCVIFWWGYEGGLKDDKKRPKIIEHTYNRLKALEGAEIDF